jgi:hypothetical protein
MSTRFPDLDPTENTLNHIVGQVKRQNWNLDQIKSSKQCKMLQNDRFEEIMHFYNLSPRQIDLTISNLFFSSSQLSSSHCSSFNRSAFTSLFKKTFDLNHIN